MILSEGSHRLTLEPAWVYGATYPQFLAYEAVFSFLKPIMEEKRALSVLEEACGTGRLMAILGSGG